MDANGSIKNKLIEFEELVKSQDFTEKKDFSDTSECLLEFAELLFNSLTESNLEKIYSVAMKLSDYKIVSENKNQINIDSLSSDEEYIKTQSFLNIEKEFFHRFDGFIEKIKILASILISRTPDHNESYADEIHKISSYKTPEEWGHVIYDDGNKIALKKFFFSLRLGPSVVNDYCSIDKNSYFKYLSLRKFFTYEYDNEFEEITNIFHLYERKKNDKSVMYKIKEMWFTRSDVPDELQKETLNAINILSSIDI